MLRFYTEEEWKIINRVDKKGKLKNGVLGGTAHYYKHGNFVVAAVQPAGTGEEVDPAVLMMGVAKRNPIDLFNDNSGKNLAFRRAITSSEVQK